MRLQNRLALTTCLFIVPVILVLIISVDSVARDRIYSAVDASLQTKATSIRNSISTGPSGLNQGAIDASLPQLDRQAAQGTAFTVVSASGSLLYSSTSEAASLVRSVSLPVEPSSPSTETTFETTTTNLGGVKTRVVRQPFFGFGEVLGYIEVREPLLSADNAVTDIRRALAIGGGCATLAIVLAVYFLAGQVVAPVRRMSELSSSIQATEDFSRRMPDVTSPREVQELTSTFNAMLQRIQDMIAAQRAFLAESSHELRRPLTILRTNLDLLRVPGLPADVRASVEEESRTEAEAMSDLVSELLILSRGELSKIVPVDVDLSSTIQRSLSEFREYCQDHVVDTHIAANVHVRGDSDGLKHVVDNLLENAHSYTPAGGTVTIGLTENLDMAVLTVTDSGQGMSSAEIEHAFDRFFRGEAGRQSGFEGFGLGLAIAKQVVASHSGAIALASSPGAGTRCTVTLPLLSAG